MISTIEKALALFPSANIYVVGYFSRPLPCLALHFDLLNCRVTEDSFKIKGLITDKYDTEDGIEQSGSDVKTSSYYFTIRSDMYKGILLSRESYKNLYIYFIDHRIFQHNKPVIYYRCRYVT